MTTVVFSIDQPGLTLESDEQTLIFAPVVTQLDLGNPIQAAGVGEANTGANVGAGTGLVFRDKTGAVLNLKSLIGGANVTVIDGVDAITIDSTAAGDVVGPAGATASGSAVAGTLTATGWMT